MRCFKALPSIKSLLFAAQWAPGCLISSKRVAAEKDLKVNEDFISDDKFSLYHCLLTHHYLPFPGLLPLTDELHLLHLWPLADLNMRLGVLLRVMFV